MAAKSKPTPITEIFAYFATAIAATNAAEQRIGMNRWTARQSSILSVGHALVELQKAVAHTITGNLETSCPELVTGLREMYEIFASGQLSIESLANDGEYAGRYLQGVKTIEKKAEALNALAEAHLAFTAAQAQIAQTSATLQGLITKTKKFARLKEPRVIPPNSADCRLRENLIICIEGYNLEIDYEDKDGNMRIAARGTSMYFTKDEIETYFDIGESAQFPARPTA